MGTPVGLCQNCRNWGGEQAPQNGICHFLPASGHPEQGSHKKRGWTWTTPNDSCGFFTPKDSVTRQCQLCRLWDGPDSNGDGICRFMSASAHPLDEWVTTRALDWCGSGFTPTGQSPPVNPINGGPAGGLTPGGAQGPPGNPGPVGPAGPTGAQGAQGPPGAASTVPGPTGPAGPQGVQGATGSQGPIGLTGATGPQGPQGAASTVPGPTGPQGAQGIQGPTGAASTVPGPAGPQGPVGATGAVGATGPQGAASTVPGPTGPQGATGPQGIQGIQGPVGATGAQGIQGPTGAQGVTGPANSALAAVRARNRPGFASPGSASPTSR